MRDNWIFRSASPPHFRKCGGDGGGGAPPFLREWVANIFENLRLSLFGTSLGVFFWVHNNPKPHFFARAFGAREALLCLSGRERAKKQCIRELVRLTAFPFGAGQPVWGHCSCFVGARQDIKSKLSSLAHSAFARHSDGHILRSKNKIFMRTHS